MSLLDGIRFGVATRDEVAGKSGLEILAAMIAGVLPAPAICKPLNFRLVEVREGFALFEGETGPELLNPMGGVHGGWALTLIDSATGCACMSTLAAGVSYTTVETKANFVRPILADTGRVQCSAQVIHRGRQIVTTESRVTDADGRLLAHGTSTLMVLAGR